MKNPINEVSRLKKLAGILKEAADQPEKIVLKKGAKVRDWTSNGEHYVLLYPDRWALYTGDDKELTTGKINVPADAKYIKDLAAK